MIQQVLGLVVVGLGLAQATDITSCLQGSNLGSKLGGALESCGMRGLNDTHADFDGLGLLGQLTGECKAYETVLTNLNYVYKDDLCALASLGYINERLVWNQSAIYGDVETLPTMVMYSIYRDYVYGSCVADKLAASPAIQCTETYSGGEASKLAYIAQSIAEYECFMYTLTASCLSLNIETDLLDESV